MTGPAERPAEDDHLSRTSRSGVLGQRYDPLVRGAEQESGGNADGFVRLFTVPGETHCGGGIALENSMRCQL